MESNRFFLWLTRLNAILILLFLLGAIAVSLFAVLESMRWDNRRAVEVVKEEDKTAQDETLRLGSIDTVCGHDAKYIELQTERKGKSYSSGSSGGQTRNIIFFTDGNSRAQWLFDHNRYLIDTVRPVPYSYSDCDDDSAVLIYYVIITDDSNNDGKLSEEDELTIAISDPYGRDYKALLTDADRVLDYELTANNKQLSILLKKGEQVVLRDYSVTGQLLAEQNVTEIGER